MKWFCRGAAAAALLMTGCPGDDGGTDTGADTETPTSTSGMSATMTTPDPTSSTGDPPDSTGPDETTGEPTSGSGSDSGSTSGSTGGSSTTMGAISIPDPGDGMDSWRSTGDVSTPELAWQVGIATQMVPYVEGTVADDGNAFFVFEAGPALNSITINVYAGVDSDYIHLHDGTGLIFGDEITPTNEGPSTASFDLTPGNIYVLEIHFPNGGFF